MLFYRVFVFCIISNTSVKSISNFRPFVAVAAIDFGTTYSGCAFSTVQDFRTNPLRIETIPLDDRNVLSYKTPTVLLLTPEKKFHSFGTKAEDHYVILAERDEADKWFYFNRFKMQLYQAKVISFRWFLIAEKNPIS